MSANSPDRPFETLGEALLGVGLRPMRDDQADYGQLAQWLTDERVLEWYEGRDQPYPLERVIAKFSPRVLMEEAVIPCFILLDGRAVGYLQLYPVSEAADYELESAEDTWAFDLFVGEPELWSTGVGSAALRLAVFYVFEERGARRAVIDPRVDNPRAIRAYEKLGFAKVKVLVGHEEHEGARRDCWLMELRAGRAALARLAH